MSNRCTIMIYTYIYTYVKPLRFVSSIPFLHWKNSEHGAVQSAQGSTNLRAPKLRAGRLKVHHFLWRGEQQRATSLTMRCSWHSTGRLPKFRCGKSKGFGSIQMSVKILSFKNGDRWISNFRNGLTISIHFLAQTASAKKSLAKHPVREYLVSLLGIGCLFWFAWGLGDGFVRK